MSKNDIRVSLKREKDLISNSCFLCFHTLGLIIILFRGKGASKKLKFNFVRPVGKIILVILVNLTYKNLFFWLFPKSRYEALRNLIKQTIWWRANLLVNFLKADSEVPLLKGAPASHCLLPLLAPTGALIVLMLYWSIGPLVHWSIGSLVPWSIGTLVYWSVGPLVHWSNGPLVHSIIGLLDFWSIGQSVPWPIERPKKSQLSGWQTFTRKNFPDKVRKLFSRHVCQKRVNRLFF